jgi:ankyrin repeat protein
MTRLLGARAKVNATDKRGQSALYLAAGVARDKTLLLLKRGATINMRTKAGFTPLLNATRTGHLGNMELLIAKGAKVNMSNKYGVTPLHWAAGFGKSAAVMMLLDAKANVKAKDENGRTPFAWAKLMGNLEGSKGYWALNRAQYK